MTRKYLKGYLSDNTVAVTSVAATMNNPTLGIKAPHTKRSPAVKHPHHTAVMHWQDIHDPVRASIVTRYRASTAQHLKQERAGGKTVFFLICQTA